jgi:hypothetical protein
MSRRAFSRTISAAMSAGALAVLWSVPLPAAGANKACGLLTPSELETVLGAKVTLSGGNAGNVELCTGRTPTVTVMLRVFKRTNDPSGATEKAGIEAARQTGAQVDVKTFGPITCSAVVPPAKLAQYGFNTTCSVRRAPMFAVIELTATSQKDAVPIEKLHALAEKMAGRF